jgi:hypothetical protein
MKDDITAIRMHVAKLVEAGQEVVLVLHSAAGMLGSNAIEDLELSKRLAAGKNGGVTKIVFLAAGIGPEGLAHSSPPFVQVDVGDPRSISPRPDASMFRIMLTLMICRTTAA